MPDRLLAGRKLILPLTLGALLVINGALPGGWLAFTLACGSVLLFPGWLLSCLLFDLPVWRRLPVAFTLSIGLLGLPTVILQRLEVDLPVLAWTISGILLILAVAVVLFDRTIERIQTGLEKTELPFRYLIPALLGAVAVLAFWAYRAPISDAGDHWFYLEFIRSFLDQGLSVDISPLVGQSASAGTILRASFNSWWALQAVLVRASGLGLMEAYWYGLPPLLIALAFLALYGFAVQLFKKTGPALLAVLFQALVVFTSIDSHSWPGNGLFLRITEDKYLVMFVLLPTALGFLLSCLEKFHWGDLAAAGLGLLAIGLTHPFGVFQWGAAAGGLLLATLLKGVISKGRSGYGFAAAGLVLLVVMIPLALRSWVFHPFDTTQSQEPPYTSQTIILEANSGRFVSNPHVIAHPLILLAISLSPILLKWLTQDRAAQFLLGATWLPLLLAFHPFYAALLGRFAGPWLVWRITWALPTTLTLAYVVHKLEPVSDPNQVPRRVFSGWTSLAILAMMAVLLRAYLFDSLGLMRDQKYRFVTPAEIELLEAVREQAGQGEVVLAPPLQNNHLPAFSSESKLLSFRIFEASPGSLDRLVWFYGQMGSGQAAFDLLQEWNVRLVVLPQDQGMLPEWKSLPAFFVSRFENKAFTLFEVRSYPQVGGWTLPEVDPASQAQTALPLPNPAENDLRDGNKLREAGDFEGALQAYSSVLAREPEIFGLRPAVGFWKAWGRNLTFDRRADRVSEALLGMGALYELRGQDELAESAYTQLIALHPDRETGYLALENLYKHFGQEDQILPLYQEADQIFFWLTWPKIQLSEAYLEQDHADNAVAALKAALRLEPNDVFIFVRLARLYRVERALDLALYYGLQAENRAYSTHEIAQAHYELGQIYWARGQNELALEHFLIPVDVIPDNPVLHATIGDFYLQAENNPQAALPYYLKAVSLAPDNAAYRLLLGDIYRDLGEEEKAGQAYGIAAQLNPDLPGLQERLQQEP